MSKNTQVRVRPDTKDALSKASAKTRWSEGALVDRLVEWHLADLVYQSTRPERREKGSA
jgi:hypothetical protein